jgi:hypothetical protein
MFLKHLWDFNKAVALVFVLFILSWGYINYKQGAVAAPLFQYGMFSGKFFINDTQKVIRLYVNKQPVDFTQYSMVERDMLQIPLENYLEERKTNETIFYTMKRVLGKAGIGQLMKEEKYTNNITGKDFMKWYKKRLQKILGYPVNNVDAYLQKYTWKVNSLQPVDTPLKINLVVDN